MKTAKPWEEIDNKLYKKYTFETFMDALNFMLKAAPEIDQMDHHPEWKNVYNRVEVWLCTHSAGNIVTQKDHELAALLDRLYAS